jgi:NADPH:quinone reductase-like Zn-dependent oxidoreductase
MMIAVQYEAYGKLNRLFLGGAPPDKPLARGELRIRVLRAALNPKDVFIREGRYGPLSGRSFPKRCGCDFAGDVVESRDDTMPVGTRVFGMLNQWTYLRGTLASEVTVKSGECARLPDGVSLDGAAATALVSLTALQALRDLAKVKSGGSVLVHGASGGVGTAAIQIARLLGASVTTTSSEGNRALCLELGAREARDYKQPDALAGRFDAIFDAYGNLKFPRVRGSLAPGGTFVSTVPRAGRILKEAVSRLVPLSERMVVVWGNRADLELVGRWLASGELRAVIDSRFPLADFADAFRRLESRRARGKIVIDVAA